MRQILYSKEFDLAVENIGGYELFDEMLEIVLDGLVLNPYGFPKFESDLFSFRYAFIRGVPDRPDIWVQFQILEHSKDVELLHVEILD